MHLIAKSGLTNRVFLYFSMLIAAFITFFSIFILHLQFKNSSVQILEAWFKNEIVMIQQGDLLGSISKLQRNINSESMLKGILVVNGKHEVLFQYGKSVEPPNDDIVVNEEITVLSSNVFSNIVGFRHNNVVVYFFSQSKSLYIIMLLLVGSLLIPLLALNYFTWYFAKLEEIKRNELEINKLNNEKMYLNKIFELSQKLAHDIRSPISTLNLVSSKISDPEIRNIQLSVVNQINGIANGLLIDSKNPNHAVNLGKLLNDLKKEYELKQANIQRQFIFKVEHKFVHTQFSYQQSLILYRCLNNFIQNSIEATSENGEINISVFEDLKKNVIIQVKDNGKGIPEHVLKQLGKKTITYGKEDNQFNSGSGIALYNAKKDLNEFGVDLVINSKVGEYTSVEIQIPSLQLDNHNTK